MVESYWTALKGTRAAPFRSDIDPIKIEDALDYAFILERVASGMARFRLAGTHLNDLMGMEVRGMPITSFFAAASRMHASRCIEKVFSDLSPAELKLVSPDPHMPLEAQMLILPLMDEDGLPTRAIGVLESRGAIGMSPKRFELAHTAALKSSFDHVLIDYPIPEFAEAPRPFKGNGPDDKRPAVKLVWNEDDPTVN